MSDQPTHDVIVDVPESASWVEDQFPDEVAYLLAAYRADLAAKVRALSGTVVRGVTRYRRRSTS